MSKLPLSLLVAGASALAVSNLLGASFTPNDPLYPSSADTWGQWHLRNTSSIAAFFNNAAGLPAWTSNVRGNNVVAAWSMGYTGTGVVIGFIDDGVEGGHEDLAANYRGDLSKNFSQGPIANQAQRPYDATDSHGTAVAGVAAAVGGNGIGVTGAAPRAGIAGLRIKFGSNTTEDPVATDTDCKNAFLWGSGVTADGAYTGEATIHIKNNSWGYTVPFVKMNDAAINAISTASKNNVIFVFAAGNDRGAFTEQASSGRMNSIAESINVAAFGADGKFTYYSSFGSSVFVSAASNGALLTVQTNNGTGIVDVGIVTTDRTGVAGYNATSSYFTGFGGTSSASPLVSGIIALGKEANPALDARWAKQALAYSSYKIDPTDKNISSGVINWDATSYVGRGWQTNGAGLNFNPNYGFGAVDAGAFVQRVLDIAYVTEQTSYTHTPVSINGAQFHAKKIDTDTGNVVAPAREIIHRFTLSSAQISQSLETVVLSVNISGGKAWKDFLIQLISPSGMVSDLYMPMTEAPTQAQIDAIATFGIGTGLVWDFVSNAFYGESGIGEWTLVVKSLGNDTATLNSANIKFNQGNAVLETALSKPLTKNVTAHALVIDRSGTNFVIPSGITFTVADSTIVNDGKVEVAGRLTETAFKGNQLVVNGGTLTIANTGIVDAKRGALLKNGTLNLSGALNAEKVTVQETTTVEDVTSVRTVSYNYGLIISGGGAILNAGENGTVTTGILQTAGTVNIDAGKKLTTPKFDVQGQFNNTGILLAASTVELSGTLASTLTARDGAVINAKGNSLITGNLTVTGIAADGTAAKVTVTASSNVTVNGTVDIMNGIFTIKAPTFKSGKIQVSGGTMIVEPQITFNTAIAQTGGVIRLSENTTFLNNVTINGGNFYTSANNNKTLTTTKLLLGGNGMFSPGDTSAVSLTLNGDFEMNGGVLAIDLTTAKNDLITVNGKVTLNNGSLKLNTTTKPKLSEIGTKVIKIIEASNGISGVIRYVTGDNAYTDRPTGNGGTYAIPVSYKYVSNVENGTGNLIIGYDYVSSKFIDELNANQREIGVALNLVEANGTGITSDPLLLALNEIQSIPALADAYDQLMPVNLLSLARTSAKQAAALTNTFDRRSREIRRGALQPGSFWTNYLFGENYGFKLNAHPTIASTGGFIPYSGLSDEFPLTLWANGYLSTWKGKDTGSIPHTKSTQYSGTLGLDYRWETDDIIHPTTYNVGVFMNYTNSTDKIGNVGSRNDTDAVSFAGYLSAERNGYYGNLLAAYSINRYDFRREVNIANQLSAHATANPDGNGYLGYIGVGYEWEYENWSHGPTASLQYSKTNIDNYTETGAGPQSLTLDSQHFDSLLSSVGYRIATQVHGSLATFLPEVRAQWNHEYRNDNAHISSNMGGNLPFTVSAAGIGRDYFTFGVGLTALLSENISLSLDYDVSLFQKNMEAQHSGNAMLRISF